MGAEGTVDSPVGINGPRRPWMAGDHVDSMPRFGQDAPRSGAAGTHLRPGHQRQRHRPWNGARIDRPLPAFVDRDIVDVFNSRQPRNAPTIRATAKSSAVQPMSVSRPRTACSIDNRLSTMGTNDVPRARQPHRRRRAAIPTNGPRVPGTVLWRRPHRTVPRRAGTRGWRRWGSTRWGWVRTHRITVPRAVNAAICCLHVVVVAVEVPIGDDDEDGHVTGCTEPQRPVEDPYRLAAPGGCAGPADPPGLAFDRGF